MSDTQESAPQALDRKELLAQQFSDVETNGAAPNDGAPPKTDDRPRDDAGKFVAKPTQETNPQADTSAAPAAETPAWVKPPASWKKDFHQGWETLPENYRQYIHDREQQMRAGVEPLLPKAQFGEAINKVLEPYMPTIRGLGLEPQQAVAALADADYKLRTLPHEQKLPYVVNLLRGYGIDISGQMQQARPMYDQGYQTLQNELLGVKSQLSEWQQSQKSAEERALQNEIQKFSATAEHFEEAKPTMIKLLQGGIVDNVKDAYEQAVYLDPTLRERVLAAQQAKTSADAKAAADAAAKRARAAAVSPRSATPGVVKATNAQSRREMLSEAFGNMDSRL